LRRIFEPSRKTLIGGWRKTRIEKLCNLYSSQTIMMIVIREDEMGGRCSPHAREEKCGHNFGKKPRRKETTWKT
jgi:hypothetical protein